MNKDFKKWSSKKKELEEINKLAHFHEREFWWCCMGNNIGSEQDGKGSGFLRPVIILKKINKNCFYGLPLSSSDKNSYYNFHFTFKGKHSNAILSQLRLFSVKRLIRKEGRIGNQSFNRIKHKIKELFA